MCIYIYIYICMYIYIYIERERGRERNMYILLFRLDIGTPALEEKDAQLHVPGVVPYRRLNGHGHNL